MSLELHQCGECVLDLFGRTQHRLLVAGQCFSVRSSGLRHFGAHFAEIEHPPAKACDTLRLEGRGFEQIARTRALVAEHSCQGDLRIVAGDRLADPGVGTCQTPFGADDIRPSAQHVERFVVG